MSVPSPNSRQMSVGMGLDAGIPNSMMIVSKVCFTRGSQGLVLRLAVLSFWTIPGEMAFSTVIC
ncbi:hypothetical protein ADUPG1_004239, partial [Aduncisulcus paluster]